MSELIQYIKEFNYQKIKLLSGKPLDIRGWVMKEEKDFLFAVETRQDDKDFMVDESISLARKCVRENTVDFFDKLSRNDILFTLTQMRKISKGNTVDFSYRCINPECDDWVEYPKNIQEETGLIGQGKIQYESKIDLEKDIETKTFDDSVIKVGKLKFHIQEVSYMVQKEMESQYIKKDSPNLTAFNYYFVLNSIKAIEIGEKTINDFSREELIQFVDSLGPNDFEKLSDGISSRVSNFNIKKNVSCPKCDFSSDVVYEEMFSLMVF